MIHIDENIKTFNPVTAVNIHISHKRSLSRAASLVTPPGASICLKPFLTDVPNSQLACLLSYLRDVPDLLNLPGLYGNEVGILQLATLHQGLDLRTTWREAVEQLIQKKTEPQFCLHCVTDVLCTWIHTLLLSLARS